MKAQRITCCLSLIIGSAWATDSASERVVRSITADELREIVRALSADNMEGREAGTRGNQAAVDYVEQAFREAGLQPVGDFGGFRQGFRLRTPRLGSENHLRIHSLIRDANREGRLSEDFFPVRSSGVSRASASAVFVGYGLPESPTDYQSVEVEGKVAVALRGVPADAAPEWHDMDSDEREYLKGREAQRRMAAALIVVDVNTQDIGLNARLTWPQDASLQRPIRAGRPPVQIPVVVASLDLVRDAFSNAGVEVGTNPPRSQASRILPALNIQVSTSLAYDDYRSGNVLGLFPGGDEALRDEVVVVGAHIDHLGIRDGEIYRGADDDASGIAGLLEIAEALALARSKPRRSILLAAWNAEEKGLQGVRHYLDHPSIDLSRTIAMLQMDMIGRDEEVPNNGDWRFQGLDGKSAEESANTLHVLGYSRSPGLEERVRILNRRVLLTLLFELDGNPINLLRRSDHWPFLQKGVPSLLFTTGLHPDYHSSADTPEKLNYRKLEQVAQLVFLCAWDSAQREERPTLSRMRGPQ